jgi:hypothetical protein
VTGSNVLGLLAAVGTTVFILELLRRRILREKYAVLWLAVAAGLLVFSVFPGLLTGLADLLGFEVPANLLFAVSAVLLLLVSVQLSYEVSRVEARTRRLAEELALLRRQVDELRVDPPDA